MSIKPRFKPGKNIAIKVPSHEFESMLHFYKVVLGLKESDATAPGEFESRVFEFGDKNLWIDSAAEISQAEVWLEIETDNAVEAKAYLQNQGCILRDEIEPLPSGFKGFWLNSPSNIIHLVSEKSL